MKDFVIIYVSLNVGFEKNSKKAIDMFPRT